MVLRPRRSPSSTNDALAYRSGAGGQQQQQDQHNGDSFSMNSISNSLRSLNMNDLFGGNAEAGMRGSMRMSMRMSMCSRLSTRMSLVLHESFLDSFVSSEGFLDEGESLFVFGDEAANIANSEFEQKQILLRSVLEPITADDIMMEISEANYEFSDDEKSQDFPRSDSQNAINKYVDKLSENERRRRVAEYRLNSIANIASQATECCIESRG